MTGTDEASAIAVGIACYLKQLQPNLTAEQLRIIMTEPQPGKVEQLHRALSGQTLTPRQLRAAGWFVAVWFLMDVVQFFDMIWGWMK